MGWAVVGKVSELSGDGAHHVSHAGVDAVLLRVGGAWKAYQGLCPHQGALLGEGHLQDGQLVCRNHGWRFDVGSGERTHPATSPLDESPRARRGNPRCLQAIPVREVDGRVELDLSVLAAEEKARATRTREDLPGPRGLPLVGNALQLDLPRLHLILERWAAGYGTYYRYDLGARPIVVVSDPVLMNEAYRLRPDTYRRFGTVEPVFTELGVHGVFSAEGAPWRPQRKLAMAALNRRNLEAFFPLLRRVAERLHARWAKAADDAAVVDLQADLMRFTVDVTTQLAFSHPTDSLGDEDSALLGNLAPILPLIAHRTNAAFPHWRWFRLPSDRRGERAIAEVRAWCGEVIAKTRAELDADPERAAKPRTLLDAMLLERDAEGRPFSDEVIFGNAVTMLLAGEDTTANTLSWAVHLLLDAPQVVARLRDEADAALGDALAPPDLESVERLDYVEAVANETMRLKPVAPVVFLENNVDVVLGDVALEKGTGICMLTRPPSVDAAHVTDPLRFDPDRWSDPKVVAAMQRSGVFTPFGSGPRICPGRSLALLEMRVVLATLFRSFVPVRVGRAEEVEEVFGFTMSPSGLRVRFERREAVTSRGA